jgi:5-methylcytosine-specific restriction endonuclease McrBC regulatory subunit McrC
MIKTVDNFSGIADTHQTVKQLEGIEKLGYSCAIAKDLKKLDNLNISLKQYQSEKYPNNTFFSFFKDEEKKASKNSDDLIISIRKEEEAYTVQAGNYVGKIVWDGLEIDIRSRFSDQFLQRMLNFANDVFLDDISVFSANETKNLDFSKYVIYYLFIQNLEKAFLLGLPKAYKSINHHEMKLKGKIDINRFIKSDIPFQGKISSTSREQIEIQEIIDTLYKAVKIIDKNGKNFTKNISHIRTHLKQYKSNSYVSSDTISKALKSRALQNPIFSSYKKVFEYARFIINGSNLEEKKDGKNQTYGFLVNVAELFEIYITKLLQKEFPEWYVESPKIELYPNQFFARKIIPDIVMSRGKDIMVFDTKYKRMHMEGRNKYGAGDVDRNDFFQINTYMSYYQNHSDKYNIVVGGLLYPIEKDMGENQYICHSGSWFDNLTTSFIVDGVDLTSVDNLIDQELKFINRIKLQCAQQS